MVSEIFKLARIGHGVLLDLHGGKNCRILPAADPVVSPALSLRSEADTGTYFEFGKHLLHYS